MRVESVTDDLLNSAFDLAYLILGDRPASIYVAMAAMDKLKAASALQGRRLYYTPIGRSAHPATRNKVNLSDLHLLQRLIYIESELFERLLEGQDQSLRVEDLIIRYVKHLIRITTKHNSFYVTLGLCRLLYNYTTSETAEIYNLVLQDPLRMRDDHYYRSRKKLLMEEMKTRFGNLIRTERGFRRAERFQPDKASGVFVGLVKDCLLRFTPWQSTCVLPRELDPKRNVVSPLMFDGGDPDAEHEIELNRIHSLTHPTCFERLTAALGLDPPDQRLELPQFFVSGGGPRAAATRFNPTELSEGELNAIKQHLDKHSAHRNSYSNGRLICLIDQARVSVFEPGAEANISLDLEADSELLEIRSVLAEDEIPVAVCPIAYDKSGIARATSLAVLERGQRFSFEIKPRSFEDTTVAAEISISYQSPRQRVLFGLLPNFAVWIGRLRTLPDGRVSALTADLPVRPRRLVLGLAMLLVAIFAAGWWGYVHLKRSQVPEPLLTQNHEAKAKQDSPFVSPPATVQSQSSETPRNAQRRQPQTEDAESRKLQPDTTGPGEPAEETRGSRLRSPATSLGSAKRVYVDPLGDDDFSRQLRELLIAKLKSGNRFMVVTNRDEADAVFKPSASRTLNESGSIALELVDASGQTIWSFTSDKHGRKFSSAAEASEKIVQALLIGADRDGRKH